MSDEELIAAIVITLAALVLIIPIAAIVGFFRVRRTSGLGFIERVGYILASILLASAFAVGLIFTISSLAYGSKYCYGDSCPSDFYVSAIPLVAMLLTSLAIAITSARKGVNVFVGRKKTTITYLALTSIGIFVSFAFLGDLEFGRHGGYRVGGLISAVGHLVLLNTVLTSEVSAKTQDFQLENHQMDNPLSAISIYSAILSLLMVLTGLFFLYVAYYPSIILGPIAIITGVFGLRNASRSQNNKGKVRSFSGIGLGVVSALLFILFWSR